MEASSHLLLLLAQTERTSKTSSWKFLHAHLQHLQDALPSRSKRQSGDSSWPNFQTTRKEVCAKKRERKPLFLQKKPSFSLIVTTRSVTNPEDTLLNTHTKRRTYRYRTTLEIDGKRHTHTHNTALPIEDYFPGREGEGGEILRASPRQVSKRQESHQKWIYFPHVKRCGDAPFSSKRTLRKSARPCGTRRPV